MSNQLRGYLMSLLQYMLKRIILKFLFNLNLPTLIQNMSMSMSIDKGYRQAFVNLSVARNVSNTKWHVEHSLSFKIIIACIWSKNLTFLYIPISMETRKYYHETFKMIFIRKYIAQEHIYMYIYIYIYIFKHMKCKELKA